MKHIIYSAGYQNLDVAQFCWFVNDQQAVVADVRLKPYSRQHQWNQKALVARLGARYAWIPELGNLNYKGGPIVLNDEPAGLAKLRELLEKSHVIILCVCANPATCHRTVAISRLGGDYEVCLLFPARLKALIENASLQKTQPILDGLR